MDKILVQRADGIVNVTFNRPQKKNAVDFEMWARLAEVFREVAQRPGDRVLVLSGAGGNFCSGADLSGGGASSAGGVGNAHQLDRMQYFGGAGLALHELQKPTIAKVEGVAVGAGMNLALGCDLIVASENARFSEIFAQRGLSVDLGGSWLLPRLVGLHKAKELLLLAEIIGAQQAQEMGLVNRVVPAAELDEFVRGWARRLAAGPPLALQMSKRMCNSGLQMSLSEMLHWEAMAQSVNFYTEDGAEAMRAFAEKRAPKFQGK